MTMRNAAFQIGGATLGAVAGVLSIALWLPPHGSLVLAALIGSGSVCVGTIAGALVDGRTGVH